TRVDFPLPDRPITTNVSPSCTVSETPLRPTVCLVRRRTSSLLAPARTVSSTARASRPKILYRSSTTILAGRPAAAGRLIASRPFSRRAASRPPTAGLEATAVPLRDPVHHDGQDDDGESGLQAQPHVTPLQAS